MKILNSNFMDKKNRNIIIKRDNSDTYVIAYYNNQEISRFEYEIKCDDYDRGTDEYIYILHMNTIGKFQKSGIGTKICDELKEEYGLEIVFPRPKYETPDAMFYLTGEGEAFVTSYRTHEDKLRQKPEKK